MTLRRSPQVRRAIFVGTALLFASASAPTQVAGTQENALLSEAKAAIDSDKEVFLAIRSIETKALASASAAASRDGDRLILYTRSGGVKVYQDRPECKSPSQENECKEYRLIAYSRFRRVFVVAMLSYESLGFLLVDDASGSQTMLPRFPNFSPTGEHIVLLLMNDTQLGFAVQVWRREGDKFVLDWSGSPHNEGWYTSYHLIRWIAENTIELRAETRIAPLIPPVTKHFHFELRQAASGWEVVTLPE